MDKVHPFEKNAFGPADDSDRDSAGLMFGT